MADLSKATAQPIKINLGDKELVLSPITVGDLAKFESYCKEQRLERFLSVAKTAGMEKDERFEGVTRLLSVPFTNEDFTSEMASATGICFLLWCSIRKKHPKFELKDVDQLSDLEELMNAVTAISNLGRMAENPTQEASEAGEDSA